MRCEAGCCYDDENQKYVIVCDEGRRLMSEDIEATSRVLAERTGTQEHEKAHLASMDVLDRFNDHLGVE